MDLENVIRQLEFADDLDDRVLDAIAARARPVRLIPGSPVVNRGFPCSDVLLMSSGRIRVFLLSPNGREVTLYHLLPGQLCMGNVLAATTGGKSCVNAKTTTLSEGAILSSVDFRELIREHDPLREVVLSAIADRVASLFSLIERLCFVKVETRLADYLLSHQNSTAVDIPVNLTHAEIAAELGSAREVITRTLKQFTELGAIDTRRRNIEIVDSDLLREISQRNH